MRTNILGAVTFCFALVFSSSLFAQVAYITASPSDCSACVDLPLFAFEQLDQKFVGDVKVVMGSSMEEINQIYINSFFGWDSLMAEKYVIQDSALYQKLSVGLRSGLIVQDCEGNMVYRDLLARFSENVDSVINVCNKQVVESCLKKSVELRVDDPKYSFLLNVLLGVGGNGDMYFMNSSNYLPYVLWKCDTNGHVSRYRDIIESEYIDLINKLQLKKTFPGGFDDVKKLCKKSRVQLLHISNAILLNDVLYCVGEFNFDVNEDKDLIYTPVVFTMDQNFNLDHIWALDRKVPESNYFVLYLDGYFGKQLFVKDSLLYLKIYDPDYLPGYVPENVQKDHFFTSAIFQLSKDSLQFLGYNGFELAQEQIESGDYYYNNWSYFIDLDSVTGVIYMANPEALYVSNWPGKEIKTYHLGTLNKEWKLVYASGTIESRILRVFQDGSDFIAVIQSMDGAEIEVPLGQLKNPAFCYQEGVLHIVSTLPKKNVELRQIYIH
ncbi:MAG: hypothetical protein CMN32_02155 [Saprospirales bacterium]|nr:hypothetical protein [Saprospirales bacterium]